MKINRRNLVLGGLVGAISPIHAFAASTYPSEKITLVVPFSPGGTSDSIARPFAQVFSKVAKVSVIVLNKPGANGEIGTSYVARSKPNGYTVLLALPSIQTAAVTDRLSGRKPAFNQSDLEPIARLTSDPTIVATRTTSKWKTLKEFIEDAKKHPGQRTYGSGGTYAVSDISMRLLEKDAGFKAQQVPFNGGGDLIMALLSGQVDVGSNTYGTLSPYFKSGQLRPLAVQGDSRIVQLPDTPTTGELNFRNATYAFWTGIFLPIKTPKSISDKLRQIISESVKDRAFLDAIGKLGDHVAYLDKPQFEAFMKVDAKRQIELIESLGKLTS